MIGLVRKVVREIFNIVSSHSPGAGGDLVAMKGPQGFSFFFINYIYIDKLLQGVAFDSNGTNFSRPPFT